MLLTQKEVQTFSDTLDIPALEIELERAIWQVEQKLAKGEDKPEAGSPGVDETKTHDTTPEEKKKE